MSKEESNNCGLIGVIFGILAILFASAYGLVMGIVGIVFAYIQRKHAPNKWSKAGMILNIIGIILSIGMLIFTIYLTMKNPQLQQLQQLALQQ